MHYPHFIWPPRWVGAQYGVLQCFAHLLIGSGRASGDTDFILDFQGGPLKVRLDRQALSFPH